MTYGAYPLLGKGLYWQYMRACKMAFGFGTFFVRFNSSERILYFCQKIHTPLMSVIWACYNSIQSVRLFYMESEKGIFYSQTHPNAIQSTCTFHFSPFFLILFSRTSPGWSCSGPRISQPKDSWLVQVTRTPTLRVRIVPGTSKPDSAAKTTGVAP
jgi:hypothetical protein